MSSAFEWNKCEEGKFTVKDVLLSPDPVRPGGTAEFTISAVSSTEPTGSWGAKHGWVLGAGCLCCTTCIYGDLACTAAAAVLCSLGRAAGEDWDDGDVCGDTDLDTER